MGERQNAVITVSAKQVIGHEDPGAAGFERGYWWKVVDDVGTFESGCATRDEAVAYARDLAYSHGYSDDQIEGP